MGENESLMRLFYKLVIYVSELLVVAHSVYEIYHNGPSLRLSVIEPLSQN